MSPSLSDIRALFIRSVRALMPDADTSERNPLMQYGTAVGGVAAAIFRRMEQIRRDSVPSTASLQGAIVWGEALRVPRKGPTQAHGKAALQVRGATGATVIDGAELRAQASGVIVRVVGHHVIGGDGFAYVDVTTVDRGLAANLEAGIALRFVSAPAGIQEAAKLVKSLQGGFDDEPVGSYQARVARRLAEPPQGGNIGDYRRWIEDALPDVLLAGYPLPMRNGRGTVDIVGLRYARGRERILTEAERAQILDFITPRKLATDQVRVIETVPRIVDIEVAITPVSEPRFRFDFADRGGMVIDSWEPATRELTFAETLPADIAPNKRISLRMANGGQYGNDGAEQLIAAITGPDRLVLVQHPDRPVPNELGAGDVAFAGGPLVERARRAILDGYRVQCDGQGAHIPGLDALGPANPTTRYGSWLDRIEPSRVEAAARAQASVDDARCVAPTAAVVPVDAAAEGLPPPGATETIEVLLAGQVIVRAG